VDESDLLPVIKNSLENTLSTDRQAEDSFSGDQSSSSVNEPQGRKLPFPGDGAQRKNGAFSHLFNEESVVQDTDNIAVEYLSSDHKNIIKENLDLLHYIQFL